MHLFIIDSNYYDSTFYIAIIKNIDRFEAITEKIQILTKRLRDEGLKFSDKPTQNEIDKIKKESERKKDMEGINTNDILSPTKKRRIDSNTTTSSSSTGATTSSSSSILHKSTTSKTGSSLSSNTDSKPAESSSSGSSSNGGVSKVKKPVQYNSSDEEGDF